MGGGRRRTAALGAALVALALPVTALAAFPGTDPNESPRANTPDDPGFDRCEADDPDTPPGDCDTYFEEQFGSFGFSPDSAQEAPGVKTQYDDCSQLDQQGRNANVKSGDPSCSQISGVRADTAWKYSPGTPGLTVAILDTGIRWQNRELDEKVHLNRGELPTPKADLQTAISHPSINDCRTYDTSSYDANGDGVFNIEDYACDSRVSVSAGDDTRDTGTNADTRLDASDLIATFSNGADNGANGYVDDIAGWDFFDDDNDPYDASSCCSANGHGSGRAREALAETHNGVDETGMCPKCQLMPLRIWDSFVPPTDNWAFALTYAADNGASVAEGAIGGLTNTRFARNAVRYADEKGMALMLVSSDINSANHNYPTNYNEAIYVAGSFPDTAPNSTCSGPGGLPGFGDVLSPPAEFEAGCEQLLEGLSGVGVTPTAQPFTTSFFRNSNLTQYGGKADIVLMGTTGSENTGQAAGVAGLLESYARARFAGSQFPAGLSGNETRQLLTMSAEDVLPQNTGSIGLPDKANPGWDPHFGYGRVNLAGAMARIRLQDGQPIPAGWPCGTRRTCIPPEAQIDAPDWFSPIDVARVPASGVEVRGYAAAPHAGEVGAWTLEYACGQDARDSDFQQVPGASGTGPVSGVLGTLSKSLLVDLADNCDGEVANDAGRPAGAGADGAWPADPYPNPDPERHAFQIRLTVHEAANPSNIGRYRKTLFAYRDDGNLTGWPKPIGPGASAYATGSGGETSPRLYDVDGDNKLDVLLPTSSGELYALHSNGAPVQSFNGGQPVRTNPISLARNHPVDPSLSVPRESLRVPAIGDIDGDGEAEIVATAGERVYAWNLDGSRVPGFPVRVLRALSDPCKPGAPHPCFDASDRQLTTENHLKRGFIASPALADLNGDLKLDIVAGALDQHLYAWDGSGQRLPGFPVKLSSPGAPGAEIVTSPAIAQLDGQGPPEVIVATNEVVPGDPQPPGSIFDLFNAFIGSSTGSNPVYAVHGDGTMVDGWPVQVGVLAGDLLPLVVPGNDSAVLDVDGDGDDEVSVSAATSLSGQGPKLVDGDGSTIRTYQGSAANCPDQGAVINLADYPSVGDLSGDGAPDVVKGGLSLNGAANLLAVNQNLPFCHVEQAWNPATGTALPGYPRATDDFQLLSQASIARVSGGGPGHQALMGTGLYQVHAYGATGTEASGWPKFTGGWIESTPTVGDADGDGRLDVGVVTREGWSFLWRTGISACGDSNDQWWSFHHDERGTANYGVDGRPPGSPENLVATRNANASVTVSWRQPGDDWLCGAAARYRVIAADGPIQHPGDGQVIADVAASGGAGQTVSRTFTAAKIGGADHVAVLYRDEAGNWGLLRGAQIR
jgi:Subtilase family